MKRTIITMILLLIVAGAYAQKMPMQEENGFIPTPSMRYKDYKDYYDTNDYKRRYDDKYSVIGLGVASFFIPGLGQAIEGRWGSAAGFCAANVACNILTLSFMERVTYIHGYREEYRYKMSPLSYVTLGAGVFLNIWSIVDAVQGAKIMNLYVRDMKERDSAVRVSMLPYVTTTPAFDNNQQTVAGMAFRLSF